MIKLLLVARLTLVRSSLRALLDNSGQVEVVGDAASGKEAIKRIEQLNPQIIVLDMSQPGPVDIDTTVQIHNAHPHVHILGLSLTMEHQDIFGFLRAGASGYLTPNATRDELLTAIQTVVAGRTYLSSSVKDLAAKDYVALARGKGESKLDLLSAREREVLQLIADGHSSAAIARRIHISARTVDTHRHNIMKKLAIHSVAGLTKFAVRHGLSSL